MMMFKQNFYVDHRRMVLAISYIMVFTCGFYIGAGSPYLPTFQSYDEKYLTFKTNINQKLVNIPDEMSFISIGTKYQTDKVTGHRYGKLYEKYIRQYVGTNITMLEIGLGCGMGYGPGASAYLWRNYLGPHAIIHFIEYNTGCGVDWYKIHGEKLNVIMHYGSQEDIAFLNTINAEQGYFDFIVDDGGHSMNQQKTSLIHLLPKVRSGGVYVLEDLETSYTPGADSGYHVKTSTLEFIKNLVNDIQVDSPQKSTQIVEKITSFELSNQICVFVKK